MEFVKREIEVYFDEKECDTLDKTCVILEELIKEVEENNYSIVYNKTIDKECDISDLRNVLDIIYGFFNEDIIVY